MGSTLLGFHAPFGSRKRPLGLVDPSWLKCGVWVYPNAESATAGNVAGGSGFLVTVPMENRPDTELAFMYVVTCRHCLMNRRGEAYPEPAIVARRRDGEIVPITIPHGRWRFHEANDDLAIGEWEDGEISNITHDVTAVSTLDFVDESMVLTVGTEVFYIGRFEPTNTHTVTTARFGNISVAEPITLPGKELGIDQLSFVIESRTRVGYSGSPVVALLPTPRIVNSQRVGNVISGGVILETGSGAPKLLGMVWELWEDEIDLTLHLPGASEPTTITARTDLNAGMMGVVPAWRIMEALNLPELKDDRAQVEKEHSERAERKDARTGPQIRLASSDGADTETSVSMTRQTFFDALGKIKKEPGSPASS